MKSFIAKFERLFTAITFAEAGEAKIALTFLDGPESSGTGQKSFDLTVAMPQVQSR